MPNFRHRLTRPQQRQYDRSNAVTSIPVRVSARMARAVELIERALAEADRGRTERLAQILCDELCGALRVQPVRVAVRGRRLHNRSGELHGLYEPDAGPRRDRIQVWMMTAKRGQVVAFRTFLRTLLHEVCHHLDYQLLKLEESFHTDGFFRRESSLVHQLLKSVAPAIEGEETARPRVRLREVPPQGGRLKR
jgi:hypothetical protein